VYACVTDVVTLMVYTMSMCIVQIMKKSSIFLLDLFFGLISILRQNFHFICHIH